jgi:streptomycin 6-kinase
MRDDEMLEHYCQHWNLTDPQLLTETVTSHIYTITYEGERVVLKLLKPYGWEERSGGLALDYWHGRGAVRLLRDEEDAYLMEYADGDTLVPMVQSGSDEQATQIIADVLNELHATTTQPLPQELITLQTWFRALYSKASEDRSAGVDSSFVRAARLAEDLLANPLDVRVLHGDMHHENVRHSQRGWLAFDPKGLVGERTYDVANTLCNPYGMPHLTHNETRLLTNAGILAEAMKIDLQRVLTFLYMYANLSASWHLADGNDPAHEWAIIALVEPHIRALRK